MRQLHERCGWTKMQACLPPDDDLRALHPPQTYGSGKLFSYELREQRNLDFDFASWTDTALPHLRGLVRKGDFVFQSGCQKYFRINAFLP